LIGEKDLGTFIDPEVYGFVLVEPGEEATRVVALVRPGTDPGTRLTFAEWAADRFARFAEHGPEPDGWQHRRSDGAWQLWAREVFLPG
jgi:hypothetical protein